MDESPKKKPNKSRKIRRIATNVIMFCLAGIMLVSGWRVYTILKGYHDDRSSYDKVSEKAGDDIDFDALREINPDVIGWLRYEDTIIDYPVVQEENNEVYLSGNQLYTDAACTKPADVYAGSSIRSWYNNTFSPLAFAGADAAGGCCGTGPEHIRALKKTVEKVELKKPDPDVSTEGKIVCATEKDVFILDKDIILSDTIKCGPDLEDKIKQANRSEAEIIAVEIRSEDDLDEFEYAQYAVRKPLCIVCDDAKLLGQALMLYQGRALYAGSLSDEQLLPLMRKYGLIA